jgi:hypothetical protein
MPLTMPIASQTEEIGCPDAPVIDRVVANRNHGPS